MMKAMYIGLALVSLGCKARDPGAVLASDGSAAGQAPEGWVPFGTGDQVAAVIDQVLNEDADRQTGGGRDPTNDVGYALQDLRSDRGTASYRNSRSYSTSSDVTLSIRVSLAGNGGSTDRQIVFDTRFTAVALIESENQAAPVFTGSAQADGVDALNMRGREWARYTCLLQAELNVTDRSSFKMESGADVFFVRVGGTAGTSSTEQNQHVFIRQQPWTVVLARDFPGGVGPNVTTIDRACADYAERMKRDEGLLSDMARRARNWRYSNERTTCFEDRDCQAWHAGMIPSVVAWTVPRCKVSSANRFCSLRSIRGGTCTPAGESHVMFSYPCDGAMQCENLSTGRWIFRKSNGRCG